MKKEITDYPISDITKPIQHQIGIAGWLEEKLVGRKKQPQNDFSQANALFCTGWRWCGQR
jgi:hypothetical protein